MLTSISLSIVATRSAGVSSLPELKRRPVQNSAPAQPAPAKK
jgi:hypothetical protein